MLTPARNTNDVHIEQTDEYMAFMVLSNARYDVPTRLSTYFALAAGDAGILGAAEVNELCLSMRLILANEYFQRFRLPAHTPPRHVSSVVHRSPSSHELHTYVSVSTHSSGAQQMKLL